MDFQTAFRKVIDKFDPTANSIVTHDNVEVKTLADWGRKACVVLDDLTTAGQNQGKRAIEAEKKLAIANGNLDEHRLTLQAYRDENEKHKKTIEQMQSQRFAYKRDYVAQEKKLDAVEAELAVTRTERSRYVQALVKIGRSISCKDYGCSTYDCCCDTKVAKEALTSPDTPASGQTQDKGESVAP
jgi:phage-related minor tail protein